MITLKNKRGSNEISLMWYAIIWIIAGTIIVMGVIVFYSAKIPIKNQETNELTQRIGSCIVNQEKTAQNIKIDEEFLEKCGIQKKLLLEGKTYIKIRIEELKTKNKIIELEEGNKDIALQREIKKEAEAKEFGECSKRKILWAYNDEEKNKQETIIDLFVGTNYKQ